MNNAIKYTQIFINNEWHNSINGKTFATINPSNGETIAQIQEGDEADIDKAVSAARNAFEFGSVWRQMDASKRGALLYKLADLIESHRKELIDLEIADVGKLKSDAEFDLDCVASTLRYYGGWADKVHGKTVPSDNRLFSYTRLEPIGVCGLIIPWNYPLLMLAWKFGPALATGNTIVLKPAEQSPLSALYCASLTVEAGFPPGVINIVPGYGAKAGAALASHSDVDKISFTGSTIIGELVLIAAAKNTKRATILASGKSPIVVTNEFNLDRAVQIAHNACFANAGQVCCAATRTYVHESIYDQFVAKATKLAETKVVGDPTLPDTTQGPQVDERQFKKILDLIETGIKEGATLQCGGTRIGDKGFFIEPTVFSNVTDNMRIAREEIFGPVQQILKYTSLDEVINRCNDSQYGLAAGILTDNINDALKFSQRVRAGSVWVNCYDATVAQTTFGGFKRSGTGRELGEDAIREYTEIKTVTIESNV